MPTYAYACTACGHAFDAVQKFSDSALTECPDCGGRLRKVYTSIGVSFKGSGFYRNDSRASSNGSGNGSGASKGDPTARSRPRSRLHGLVLVGRPSTTKDVLVELLGRQGFVGVVRLLSGSSGSSSSSTAAAS